MWEGFNDWMTLALKKEGGGHDEKCGQPLDAEKARE